MILVKPFLNDHWNGQFVIQWQNGYLLEITFISSFLFLNDFSFFVLHFIFLMDKTTNLRNKRPLPVPSLEKKTVKREVPIELGKSYANLPTPVDNDRFEEFDALFTDDAQCYDCDGNSNASSSYPFTPFPFTTVVDKSDCMDEASSVPSDKISAKDLFKGTKLEIPFDPSEKLVESPIFRNDPSLDGDFVTLARNETKRYILHRQDFYIRYLSVIDDLNSKFPDYKDQIATWNNMMTESGGKARFNLKAKLTAMKSWIYQCAGNSNIRESLKEEIEVLEDYLNEIEGLEKERIQLMAWGAKLLTVWDGLISLL